MGLLWTTECITVLAFGCVFISVEGRKCPDGESECPDNSTCCLIVDEEYGCCPLADAVCCSDRLHCCPSGTTCDVEQTGVRCFRTEKSEDKQAAWKLLKSKNDITCPDRRSKCPTGTTCCDLGQGRYGCCPLPRAVCCADHLHCCPEGTQCLVHEGQCIRSETNEVIPWFRKFSSTKVVRKPALENVSPSTLCRGGTKCSDSGVCCVDLHNEQSLCCAYDSVCCRGGRHCCPLGYVCAPDEERCVKDTEDTVIMLPWIDATPSLLQEVNTDTVCDESSSCEPGSRCCESVFEDGTRGYTCCPLTEGVCCGRTCCPKGYTCADLQKCEKKAFTETLAAWID